MMERASEVEKCGKEEGEGDFGEGDGTAGLQPLLI